MSLKVNLRHLQKHELNLEGQLPVADLDLDLRDEMIHAEQPLDYDLSVELLPDSVLVMGSLHLALDCECVRCLKPFRYNIQLDEWALHLPLEGEDAVSVDNDLVDLTPYIREDILLEFPRHPLCKQDCPGLNKKRVARARETGGKTEQKPSVWSELDKLKL